MTAKHLRKAIQQLPFMFCVLKKWKYILLIFKRINSNYKKTQKIILLIIPKEKKKSLTLSCNKKTICISKSNNCLQSFTTENKLKCHEKVYKIKYF